MNIFEKLNKARVDFQNSNVKKSGKNSYAGYTYYELSDILPVINQLGNELKFTCTVEFSTSIATLTVIDCEKPEDKIIFTSPMSEASLKGCHAVQNLGAVQTYIKRYLYQNAFEIVEADALDMTMNPNEKKESKPVSPNFNKLKKQIDDYKSSGVLTNGFLKKAEMYIKQGNEEGMQNVINWCQSQVQQ